MPAMEENVLKRILPHSVEAEQSVIGSMIMDKEAIVVASELITGEDFYNRQYGILFETMVELHDSDSPVDLVTLQNKLKEKELPPEISSLEFNHGGSYFSKYKILCQYRGGEVYTS